MNLHPASRQLIGACVLGLAAATPALAQNYPVKAVRVIVPFAPGGGSDITARHFSQKLTEYLGQTFVVDNRGGAGGLIGMELTAKAPPDGYTIMMMSGSFSATAALHKPAWDPINAIVPIVEFGITPFVLTIHPSIPVKTTKEFIGLARAKPGQLAYASPGVGSITHLATELLNVMAKIQMTHIPYKSTGAAMTDLLSGQAPVIVGSLLPVEPHIGTGRLRALGVTTAKRWHTLPNVPTVGETVPGYEAVLWFGATTPRGTPQPIIDRINAAVNKALEQPDMKKTLEAQGMVGTGGTPKDYENRIRSEYARWLKVIEAAKIKVD
jgi:tripartite-type tricarboxylate transporter receptor subunit TctC